MEYYEELEMYIISDLLTKQSIKPTGCPSSTYFSNVCEVSALALVRK